MIDKQKIQQAANNYIGHEPEIDEGCNVSARREAFKDGVDWFKKNIWHSCQEEPEKGEFIVTEFCAIGLPKGSIKKLIGRELTWEDEPVELKSE